MEITDKDLGTDYKSLVPLAYERFASEDCISLVYYEGEKAHLSQLKYARAFRDVLFRTNLLGTTYRIPLSHPKPPKPLSAYGTLVLSWLETHDMDPLKRFAKALQHTQFVPEKQSHRMALVIPLACAHQSLVAALKNKTTGAVIQDRFKQFGSIADVKVVSSPSPVSAFRATDTMFTSNAFVVISWTLLKSADDVPMMISGPASQVPYFLLRSEGREIASEGKEEAEGQMPRD